MARIVKKVTETLENQLRGNDVVGRWSNLEFILLLPSTEGASAITRMERIREILDQPISLDVLGEVDLMLETRIGLADRQGGESFNSLLDQAQQALEYANQSKERINLFKIRPFI